MTLGVFDVLARLAAAAALAGVIGFERQVAQKAAGLRTHMLVGLGAGVFALMSAEAFPGSDPARVAAQIVTGVGFLGAGAIFRHGVSVRGLTTAAGMWTAAAIGLAAGLGEYGVALVATGVAVVVLYVVGVVQWLLRGREAEASVHLRVRIMPGVDVEVVGTAADAIIGSAGSVTIDEVGIEHSTVSITTTPRAADHAVAELARLDGVARVWRPRP